MTNIIVSCGKAKEKRKAPAWRFYRGSPFRVMFKLANHWTTRDKIHILSAKYGLVTVNTLLEPYEVTLAHKNAVSERVVKLQLTQFGLTDKRILMLGSDPYVEYMQRILPDIEAPLQDLKITGGFCGRSHVMTAWRESNCEFQDMYKYRGRF